MTSPPASNLPRRYPGLRPFDRTQSALFNGRGTDVQRLTNLIVRERLVVMFSKSGIGKTSLLQAGVAPELEKQGFAPILLRINEPGKPIIDTVCNELRNHVLVGGRDDANTITDMPESMWELVKRLQFDMDGLPATPVLVLDQFEELFTLSHSEESRNRFLSELAYLANESIPEAVRAMLLARIQQTNTPANVDFMGWWEQQPVLRIVISIRSDFLHLLDEISPLIPGILHNRYQLKPLDLSQASEAIVNPAKSKGEYASPPFVYSDETLQEILDFLSGKLNAEEQAEQRSLPQDVDLLSIKRFDEIESFNLQIICRYIEEEIILKHEPEGFVVLPGFYGGKIGLRKELQNFYNNQLQVLPDLYYRRTGDLVEDPERFILTAKRVIEDSLVTPAGRRCSMVDDFLTNTHSVSVEFLDTLVESRLLRKEMRLDDFYYEISHDTLLPAILESREIRQRKEQANQERKALEDRLAEEAARRKEAEKQLEETRVRRRLAYQVSFFAVTTLLVLLAFGIWLANDYVKSWRTFVGSVEQELNQIDRNVRLEIFEAAMPAYDSLLARPVKLSILKKYAYKDVAAEKADAQRFESLHRAINTAINAGDSLYFMEDYAGALRAYRSADDSLNRYREINYLTYDRQNWRISPRKILEKEEMLGVRKQNALRPLIAQFRIRQIEYETFAQANAWGQAQRCALAMQFLLPGHRADLTELQKALSLADVSPVDYVESLLKESKRRLR